MLQATLKNAKTLHRVNYSKYNPLQKLDEDKTLETRYDILQSRVGRTVCIDPDFVKILTFVILFSSDFASLNERDRREVEQTQEMLYTILRRLTFSKFSYEVALGIYASIITSISDLREMSHIKRQRSLATAVAVEEHYQQDGAVGPHSTSQEAITASATITEIN